MGEVEPYQSQSHVTDEPHQVMVIDPDYRDEEEAYGITDGGGPQWPERRKCRLVGRLQLQNHYSHDHREYTVRKRSHPICSHLVTHGDLPLLPLRDRAGMADNAAFASARRSLPGRSRVLHLCCILFVPLCYTHEQAFESFGHGWVSKHGVAKNCVRLVSKHRELNRTH